MDSILKNASIAGPRGTRSADIGITNGLIEAVEPVIQAEGVIHDLQGRLVTPGFVETHIHLDKSCLNDRISPEGGGLNDAIAQVTRLKAEFTPEDVYRRARRTLEKCIANGTTHMRTHLEVDPVVGLRSLEGILPLVGESRNAIDVEICVFPQEGLLNNPGTDELIIEGLRRGAKVVGAAPYTDSDPKGQIDRVFEIARDFDVDIDMHLDFGADPSEMDLDYVCQLTENYNYGGRVTIGHVTKLSAVPPAVIEGKAKTLANAGVAVTVLPSTDLFLMGRDQEHSAMRGVAPVHELLRHGVNCSLSTNNVLNPFTPFGDCSMVRMANLYANICHVGSMEGLEQCFQMVTTRPATLMRIPDYGLDVGCAADLVVLDCANPAAAVAEVVSPVMGFKAGRRTFTRPSASLEISIKDYGEQDDG